MLILSLDAVGSRDIEKVKDLPASPVFLRELPDVWRWIPCTRV